MTDISRGKPAPYLIIGGYGAVGSRAVSALRTFQPELPIVVAGRNAGKAADFAANHANVTGIAVDTRRADLGIPSDMSFSGVAVLTDELSTTAAEYAMERGIPYFSIATTLAQMQPKLALHIKYARKSASLILDTSFAGTVAAAALNFTSEFSQIDRLDIATIMDEEDLGGATAEESEDLVNTLAGLLLENSRWRAPRADEVSRTITLLDGSEFVGMSFATFDISELVLETKARSGRLDFGMGITPGRSKGGPPSAEVLYEIEGTLRSGEHQSLTVQMSHPGGQTTLTAVGVAVAIEVLLGLVNGPVEPGLYLPTTLIPSAHMHERLRQSGAVFQSVVSS